MLLSSSSSLSFFKRIFFFISLVLRLLFHFFSQFISFQVFNQQGGEMKENKRQTNKQTRNRLGIHSSSSFSVVVGWCLAIITMIFRRKKNIFFFRKSVQILNAKNWKKTLYPTNNNNNFESLIRKWLKFFFLFPPFESFTFFHRHHHHPFSIYLYIMVVDIYFYIWKRKMFPNNQTTNHPMMMMVMNSVFRVFWMKKFSLFFFWFAVKCTSLGK